MAESYFNIASGLTLGRNYYVVECLGAGWEGEVFKVRERRTGILRAAKIFYPRGSARGKQLLRYAQKLYKLRSCSIVTQYHHRDVARVGKEQVEILVADFAEGEMLSSFVERQRRKRLPPFEALHLLYALTLGVEQIHFLGEYHGDIHSDNVIVRRRGLGFDVHLLDFFDLGRSTREKIQYDVYDLISVLYEIIGSVEGYRQVGPVVRKIVMGRKHSLIRQQFRTAGDLRLALDNLDW